MTNPSAAPLVSADWLHEHVDDPALRIVEVGFGRASYDDGHIRGAISWTWAEDFQHPLRNDLPDREGIELLMRRSGVGRDTTVLLYGDLSNWYASMAYWLLTCFGHPRMLLLDGGKKKWMAEGRALTTDVPTVASSDYVAAAPDFRHRAMRDYVLASIGRSDRVLLDVRSRDEYEGKLMPPWTLPNVQGQRGGRIPGAVHVPWESQLREDGTFKSAAELRALYEPLGITPDKEIISYCVIGGRSNQAWFALSQLLGYPNVRLYDGSWLEWGTLRDVPIER
jgi:thiosulfate/3-mercaptopyruvate sulfurtransferase